MILKRISNTLLSVVFCFTLSACVSTDAQQNKKIDERDLARISIEAGHIDKGITLYRDLLSKQPEDTDLLYLIGRAYNQMPDAQLALHYLDKASALLNAKKISVPAKILGEQGRAKLALLERDSALSLLQQASKIDPNDALVQNSLGLCYALGDKFTLARGAFINALAITPANLQYRNNLALAWILDKQPEKGVAMLYPIYLSGKSTVKIRQNLALAFAMQGNLKGAKSLASKDLNSTQLKKNMQFYQQFQKGADFAPITTP
ncbi:hypothetical protein PCNPT3_00835 [Psychromonas sp. CNPT3]|uniref:tetratricopeptide repeat protein n=1 Tax=Psychromonas sp. CNPT3 TaxID=314282 RepID=UPI00006E7057|nr:tetratricopeptide repeat protein [Psychromonas sp. CNPT3]AGH80109.1 hypothetical protein PCNPT3_00835 [Psychromonas sp. CNPT3]